MYYVNDLRKVGLEPSIFTIMRYYGMILIRRTLLVTNKITQTYTKIKTEISIFVLRIHVVSQNISVGWSTEKKLISLGSEHKFITIAFITWLKFLIETFPKKLVR